jgi:hypothetical protein
MAIIKIVGAAEPLYEKEVLMPVQKRRFTIKQIDAQIAQLKVKIAELEKDKADALAIDD